LDTDLGRAVAIKVLPRSVAADPERLARLEREARVLAALNHPHIAAIYGTVEAPSSGRDVSRALVLELVDGETLATRVSRASAREGSTGALALHEALEIARQIAEALEAAHEKGVIHRDLKPENVALTRSGTVKVLDFGLAKFVDPSDLVSSLAPISSSGTREAVVLGTAAYMSPEQACGAAVDKRADIWAFGCVLYEMLSGRQAFRGATITETLAAVLEREPDWEALPTATPAHVRRLLRRTLQKTATLRLRDIRDARLDLLLPGDADEPADPPPRTSARNNPGQRPRDIGDVSGVLPAEVSGAADLIERPGTAGRHATGWRAALAWAAVLAALAAVAGAAGWNLRPLVRPEPRHVFRYAHVIPEDQAISPHVAVSPDGSTLVYVANRRLYSRSASELDARLISGNYGTPSKPFFSPDGQWIGFLNALTGRLEKLALTGGTPVPLAAASDLFGAEWGSDNMILYGQATGIMRVSADGGEPDLIVPVDATEIVHGPQMLPNGTHVLFSRVRKGETWNEGQIVVYSLLSGERKVVWTGGSDARYVPTGHLVYAVGDILFGLAFDVARLEVRGRPVLLVTEVSQALSALQGTAHYAISVEGTLVYARQANAPRAVPVWVGRDGRAQTPPISAPLPRSGNPRLSPDGQRLALVVERQVWVYDLTGRPAIKLTADGGQSPVWTPDGQRLVYEGGTAAGIQLRAFRADGSGTPELLAEGHFHPHGLSADGRDLIAARLKTPATGDDLVRVTFGMPPVVSPLVETPASEGWSAALSHDRRWLAYTSNRTGQSEIWVQPYPGPGVPVRVSPGGGLEPLWSRDGRELYYLEGTRLMAVRVSVIEGNFDFSPAVALFVSPYAHADQPPSYDVAPDGRFLMMRSVEDPVAQRRIIVIHNWFTELNRLVPTR
jgi:serine/threonine-protein kinase